MAVTSRPVGKQKAPERGLVLGRRESIYDTEGQHTTLVNLIQCFLDYTKFKTGSMGLAKQFGRDTNLSGSNTALPKNYRFGAYRWRCRMRTLGTALTATTTIQEEINRYREITALTIKQNRSEYMTAMADDLVSWADNKFVALANTQNNATSYAITPGTDHDGRLFEVNRKPLLLAELEQFQVDVQTPGTESAVLFTISKDIYVTPVLDGVLVRPIN